MEIPAGPQLLLRPLRLKDAKALFALVDGNRAWLRTWMPWLDENTEPQHTRAFITKARELERSGLSLNFGLWHGDRLVGALGWNWIDRANRTGHIGYWIAQDSAGQGLMTRAVRALVRHGFERLGLHRQEIRAATRNRPSRAIAERLGFRHEGTLRQSEHLYGRYVDHAVYGALGTEWEG